MSHNHHQERSIAALQQQMASGHLSAQELLSYYLDRIDRLDRSGPTLNAIIDLNPEAQDIAARLDAERSTSGPRGPLHGLPIILKANIDTADQVPTTAGSAALEGHLAAQDSFVARKLRQAGAILLGKANLSEWANFRSTRSTSGWSTLGGQTRNPYALDRNPSGSSSGSAVAVAADLCAAAVGTETDGSIVSPASANGLVGIKPTVGLVGRSGIIPISHSQDTAGPLARSVEDAAILLGAMAGIDQDDPRSGAGLEQMIVDYTQFLDPDGLRGARIGVARNYFGFHPLVDQIMERSIAILRQLGAIIVDPADVIFLDDLHQHEIELLLYEFKDGLNRYLAALPEEATVHSLADVIAFNEQRRERTMPYFGQERLLLAQEKGPLSDSEYKEAAQSCLRLSRTYGVDATMAAHELQAIIAPTGGPAWLTDLVNGDYNAGGCSSAAAVAGYPHITVPAGNIFGLPVGLSFFARAYQEPALIKFAYAFEQAVQARRPPSYLPTVDLNPAN